MSPKKQSDSPKSTSNLFTSLFLFPLRALWLSNANPILGKTQPSHSKEDSGESFSCGSFKKISRYFKIPHIFLQVTNTSPTANLSLITPWGQKVSFYLSVNPSRETTASEGPGTNLKQDFSFNHPHLFSNRTVICPTTTFPQHQRGYNFNFYCLFFLIWALTSE